MGDDVVNVLTMTRQNVCDALEAGGITATAWVPSNLYPPCALVGSAPEYVTTPIGDNPFRTRHGVTMQVLLLAGNQMDESVLEEVDNLIVNAVDALDDWDVTEVTAPFEFTTTDGYTFTAAMLTVVSNINLERTDD